MTNAAVAEVLEREEIIDTLVRYAIAIDDHDWQMMETCFTEDAIADYGEWGEVNRGRDDIVTRVRDILAGLDVSQHLISNFRVTIKGESAETSCYLQALLATSNPSGNAPTWVYGTYRDKLVRTAEGWRITHRRLDTVWPARGTERPAEFDV